jgi:hypothetical protein
MERYGTNGELAPEVFRTLVLKWNRVCDGPGTVSPLANAADSTTSSGDDPGLIGGDRDINRPGPGDETDLPGGGLVEAPEFCSGSGSTVLGWQWYVEVAGKNLGAVPDFASGDWEPTTVNQRQMIGTAKTGLGAEEIFATRGPSLANAVIQFGPLTLPAVGSVDPDCRDPRDGADPISISATFDAKSVLAPSVHIGGTGTLCTVPC